MRKQLTLNPEMKFRDFLKKFSHSDEDVFFVGSKKFSGLLDMKRIHKLPAKMQDVIKLKQVSLPLHQLKLVKKSDDAYAAFKKLVQQNIDLLPVIDGKKVVGFISRRSLLHRLSWSLNYGFNRERLSRKIV
jgi:predicted transcriptional regulator